LAEKQLSAALAFQILIVLLGVLVAAILVLHLVIGNSNVDTTTLGLLTLLAALAILPFARSITFPGGTKVELLSALSEAGSAVGELKKAEPSIALTPAPVSLPTSERAVWRDLLDSDPAIALAGLRIEIERRVRRLAEGQGVPADRLRRPIAALLREPAVRELMEPPEITAILEVVYVCNRAVHAESIPDGVAHETADLGEFVLRMLDLDIERKSGARP
jgi:hypothetical protein